MSRAKQAKSATRKIRANPTIKDHDKALAAILTDLGADSDDQVSHVFVRDDKTGAVTVTGYLLGS